MASLLDMFGTGGTQTLGLLGGDIEAARNDAQAQALYALAGSLLSGGPTGLSIARGLQQGQQAYRQAMRGSLDEQLQSTQVQDLLRRRKLEEEALKRQQMIDTAVARAYQPASATTEYQRMTPQQLERAAEPGFEVPQTTTVTPARLDFRALAPALMASREGRATLADLVAAQKAMRPETFTLAEGAVQFERDPLTGQTRQVATGAQKQEQVPSSLREFLAAQQNPAYAKFLTEQKAAQAPKLAVDLRDPTAVAKAQKDLVGDWRGVVKDTGAMEVADRFKAAKEAVSQGNAGNKSADGALIYAIGKIYDPSGAVQEGDKATILGNRSIPDSIKAYAQKTFSGQDLLPSERQGLLNVASKIVEAKAKNLESQKMPYVNLSRQLGGTGDLLMNPLADVLVEQPLDLAAAAKAAQAELARRRKGQ